MSYHLLHTEELIRRARVTPLGNLSPVDWQLLAGALATRLEKTLTPEAVEGELVAELRREHETLSARAVSAIDKYRAELYGRAAAALAPSGVEPAKPGWVERQLENSRKTVSEWSRAKKQAAGITDEMVAEPATDSPVDVGERAWADKQFIENVVIELRTPCDRDDFDNCTNAPDNLDATSNQAADLIESLTKQLEGHEGERADLLEYINIGARFAKEVEEAYPGEFKTTVFTLKHAPEVIAARLKADWARVRAYHVSGDEAALNACRDDDPIYVKWRGQQYGRGPVRWAVVLGNGYPAWVLNKDGEWEYEPQPSSRDDEFFARCRWESFDEALAAAKTARPEPPVKQGDTKP